VWESQGDKTIHGNLNGVKPSFPLDPMRLVSAVLNLRVWNPAPYFSWSCTTHLPPSPSLFKFVVLLACDHPPTTHRWPQFPCVGILQSGLILHDSWSCTARAALLVSGCGREFQERNLFGPPGQVTLVHGAPKSEMPLMSYPASQHTRSVCTVLTMTVNRPFYWYEDHRPEN